MRSLDRALSGKRSEINLPDVLQLKFIVLAEVLAGLVLRVCSP